MSKDKFNKKEKVLVIVGPTASGKTSLSITLAKKFDGEIISADSRQVYKGLDVGTEKITKEEMDGVPHHLIDVSDPMDVFSVQQFKDLATKAVEEIVLKKKLPIIVGGTGFYIDALLYEMAFPAVAPNPELRAILEAKDVSDLYKEIQEKDPERAEAIDPNNKRRLVRALEVINVLGKVPPLQNKTDRYNALLIGIETENVVLKERIEKRLDDSLMNGLVQETLGILNGGVTEERINEFGLEYRIALEVIQGKLSGKEMKEKMMTELWHYVKRQKTWFKRNKEIKWFPLLKTEEMEKTIEEFLND